MALSSREAEYIAAATASRRAVRLGAPPCELKGEEAGAVTLNIDNQSAIQLSKNPVFHDRSKHIDVKYHYIRECIEEGRVDVEPIDTKLQPADIPTKALGRDQFIQLRSKLGLVDIKQHAHELLHLWTPCARSVVARIARTQSSRMVQRRAAWGWTRCCARRENVGQALQYKHQKTLQLRSTKFHRVQFVCGASSPAPAFAWRIQHFLIIPVSTEVRGRLLRARTVVIDSTSLVLRPWTRLAHAESSPLNIKISVEIEGIPPHAWSLGTAVKMLAPYCWVEQLHEASASKADLSVFRLTVWTDNPSRIPAAMSLLITEPDSQGRWCWTCQDTNLQPRAASPVEEGCFK
ncbi:hypothetical protein U9M48_002332, partial [Paspalum notatum var. saurae]